MDRPERIIDEQVGMFADVIRPLISEPRPEPDPEPLWLTVASGIGGFLLTLLALCAVGAGIGLLAFLARFGWELGA